MQEQQINEKFSQADELIKSVHLMNNKELKFLFFSMAKRTEGQTQIKTDLTEIMNILENGTGGEQRKAYKKVINGIISKSAMTVQMKADRLSEEERKLLNLKLDDIVLVSGSLIRAKLNIKTNDVLIEFKKEFIPLLEDLKYNHTWIYLEQMCKLKGMYTPRFYEICKMLSKNNSNITFIWYINNKSEKMPSLRKFLNVENKHKEWRDLKRKVIEPSINEINEKCDDINIKYEPLKNGYKKPVYALKMEISSRNTQKSKNSENISENNYTIDKFEEEIKNFKWWE